jgi:hypothetical protein
MPKKMVDDPPVTRAMRATNANQHPGAIVAPKRRRTKAEKEQDDERESIAKEQKTAKKKEAILCVARLEDEMAVDNNNASSAHPRHHHGMSLSQAHELSNLLLNIEVIIQETEPTESDDDTELPPRKRPTIKGNQHGKWETPITQTLLSHLKRCERNIR